jgi:predicted Rossmann fold nucleotide-binding protein DprA/Smf involved in DNA uptake
MKIALTGHTNIEKALGYNLIETNGREYNQDAFKELYNYIDNAIKKYDKPTLISGMARGADEVFAIYAIKNNLPLILSIPNSVNWHKNRGLSRSMRAQAIFYDYILSYDKLEIFEIKKVYNNNEYYFANFARNQHMVDISDGIFCFKSYNSSGTDDCIKRAKEQNKFLGNIYDNFEEW